MSNAVMRQLRKMDAADARLRKTELNRIDCVEQYKSLEGEKRHVLKQMDKFAARGWTLKAFGWSNGFQGLWYALMVRDLRGKGVGRWS
jgi:hypothetical protein